MAAHKNVLLMITECDEDSDYGSMVRAFKSLRCTANVHAYVWEYQFRHPWTRHFPLWEPLCRERLNREVVQAEFPRPDIVVVVKGHLLRPWVMRAMRGKWPTAKFMYLVSDDPWATYQRGFAYGIDKDILPLFDVILNTKRRLNGRFLTSGCSRVEFFPFATDTFAPLPRNSDTECKVPIFIGNWEPDRERWLLPVAEELGLDIYGGNSWKRARSCVLRYCCRGMAPVRDHAFLYAKSGACLNILRIQDAEGHNPRSFEIPARGRVQVCQDTPDHRELLDPASTVFVKSPKDMVGACIKAMEMEADGVTGRVLGGNTWTDRAKRIIEIAE